MTWRAFTHHLVLGYLLSTETRTSISKLPINFGGASITACVTGSTRVLDDLLRDEGLNLRFSKVTDSSVMPGSHEHLKQWDITVFLRQ